MRAMFNFRSDVVCTGRTPQVYLHKATTKGGKSVFSSHLASDTR
jgi:hypothetical protein